MAAPLGSRVDAFSSAVRTGDFALARTLVPGALPAGAGPELAREIRDRLVRALALTRAARAHEAFQLARLDACRQRTLVCAAYTGALPCAGPSQDG